MTRGFLSLSQIDSRDLQRKTARRMSTKEEVWQKAKSKYGFICHMPKNREQRGVWSRGMQIGNTPWPKDQGCRIWLVTERVLSQSRTSSVQSERALCKPSCPVIVYGATIKWLRIFSLCHTSVGNLVSLWKIQSTPNTRLKCSFFRCWITKVLHSNR